MASSTYFPSGAEKQVFLAAYRARRPVLLKGPTGCGKTRFVEAMAHELDRPLVTVSCHDDLSAADLVGRFLLEGNDTVWRDGPLTRAVREGSMCYLDEVVEARSDTLTVLHSLSDHRGTLTLDRTGEELVAAPGFGLIVSYNPGYQNILKELKPSLRQRMVAITLTFQSAQTEQQIVVNETGVDADVAARLVALVNAIRDQGQLDLREVPGTRTVITASDLIAAGVPAQTAILHSVIEPLTDDPEVAAGLAQLAAVLFPDSAAA